MMIIAATGHRPDKLGGYDVKTRLALGGLATEYLSRERPDKVIVGMALGWDQAVAAACVALGIPFIAALPFKEQANRWPEEAQRRWQELIGAADKVEIISTFGHARAMQQRNEWMVDRANKMVALWNGDWGGTFNCVKYAQKRGVPIDNLWNRWSVDEDLRLLLG